MSEAIRHAEIDAEAIVARLRDLREGPAAVLQAVRLGPSAVSALESLLRGPSEPVFQPRCLAADALAAIGGRAAIEALLAALEDSIHRDVPPALRLAEDAVANRIAEHLGRRSGPPVAQVLLGALRMRPYAECARSLGRLREVRAVPLLVGCLYDDFAREAARDALVEVGAASVFALSRVLLELRDEPGLEGSVSVAARAAAAEALAGIGGVEAEYALLLARHDPERAVRIVAALAVCDQRNNRAISVLPAILEELGSTDASLRERVSQSLVGLGIAAEEALVAAAGSDEDRESNHRRLHAIEILGRIGSRRAVGALTRLTRDPDARARFAATSALSTIAGGEAIVALIGFIDDAEPSVRMRVVSALAERDASAAPALAQALGDPERAIRRSSSHALLRMGAAAVPALREAIERARSGPGGLLRRWRVRWLSAHAVRVVVRAAARDVLRSKEKR